MKKITEQQIRFVQEYMRCGNGKEAAIRAGYAEKSAETRASKLWAMPQVMEYRKELEKKLFEEKGLSREWIGNRYIRIVEEAMEGTPHLTWNPDTREYEEDGTWMKDDKTAISALRELTKLMGYAVAEETGAKEEGFEEWLQRQSRKSSL